MPDFSSVVQEIGIRNCVGWKDRNGDSRCASPGADCACNTSPAILKQGTCPNKLKELASITGA